jgi:hypothetical protein
LSVATVKPTVPHSPPRADATSSLPIVRQVVEGKARPQSKLAALAQARVPILVSCRGFQSPRLSLAAALYATVSPPGALVRRLLQFSGVVPNIYLAVHPPSSAQCCGSKPHCMTQLAHCWLWPHQRCTSFHSGP